MNPLSTHVLDTARGKPAAGIHVRLDKQTADGWTELSRGVTDADGRVCDLFPAETKLEPAVYRLRFDTAAYFRTVGVTGFYPEIVVIVQLDAASDHYHVPVLLSPFGYSTYRGS